MMLGLGLLRLSPKEFWSMSPREFSAALRHLALPDVSSTLTRQTLGEMMQQFPDRG